MIDIVLVGTIGCSGAEQTEKLIREIISEENLAAKVNFKKVVYTGQEREFNPPIYGSPTVLIDGKDIVFGESPPGITLG